MTMKRYDAKRREWATVADVHEAADIAAMVANHPEIAPCIDTHGFSRNAINLAHDSYYFANGRLTERFADADANLRMFVLPPRWRVR